MSATGSDRIADKVRLHAPRARVWRALTDPEEFGQWFGVKGLGEFAPGATVSGMLTEEGFEHVPFEFTVERMDTERLFSYRWHPYAVDSKVDYSAEPRTLVVFELDDASGGTILYVSETGFDRLPAARRSKAYEMHLEGWAAQLRSIVSYLAKAA